MSPAEHIRFFLDLLSPFISPEVVAAEWIIVAVAFLTIMHLPASSGQDLRKLAKGFVWVARRPRLAIVICGLLPMLMRLSLLGVLPAPEPSIHDEFSHLLLADTLAHGRLTNSPHPMWQHFESIHIIQQPTYNSMYPPAQGAFLAAGQVLFHEPWAGVVLSVALMCAAIFWMMQGWIPAPWALFGTLLVILKLGVLGFWMNSYMSGAVPAIGGALVIGSLPRLKRTDSRALHSVLLGLGMVILMNSRPMEGGILSIAASAYVLPSVARRLHKNSAHVLKVAILPAAALVAGGILFVGYYSWRVTGNPLRMPYMVNRNTYGWPENLAVLPPVKPVFRHKALADMYTKEVTRREHYRTFDDILASLDVRLFDNWTYLVGPILTTPLLLFPWIFGYRRIRPLAAFLAIIAVVNLFQLVLYPYHLGPVIPIIFALLVIAIRQTYIGLSRYNRARGMYFLLALPVCLMLSGTMKQAAGELHLPLAYWERAAEPQREPRAYIQNWLSARPRPQLVLVRYAKGHLPDQEWVYNQADIDGSKVVWAREMDAASNERLLRYFSNREVWLLEADVFPQHVVPYQWVKEHPEEFGRELIVP